MIRHHCTPTKSCYCSKVTTHLFIFATCYKTQVCYQKGDGIEEIHYQRHKVPVEYLVPYCMLYVPRVNAVVPFIGTCDRYTCFLIDRAVLGMTKKCFMHIQ